MKESSDLHRMQIEYENRKDRLAGSERYSFCNPSYLYMIQSRERAVLRVLAKHGYRSLDHYQICEIGCGKGGVLKDLLKWGAKLENIFGLDIRYNSLKDAHTFLPLLFLTCANGENIPFPSAKFDLVLQFTAFSSILDKEIKHHLASEMLRITRPGGMILWYDFWINPTNKQTKGIALPEIRELFPNCSYDPIKINLAAPLARKLVPFSWEIASFIEKLKFLNTHYVVGIHPDHFGQ